MGVGMNGSLLIGFKEMKEVRELRKLRGRFGSP
jgi:hypothetical protein